MIARRLPSSPNFWRLYGSILESWPRQRSPKIKGLQKGAEIRNKLIHRSKEIDTSTQEVNKYVQDVEIAIGHLLTILYPENHIWKRMFKPPALIG